MFYAVTLLGYRLNSNPAIGVLLYHLSLLDFGLKGDHLLLALQNFISIYISGVS